jgi:DNA-binding NarL/FixJ family response regulator
MDLGMPGIDGWETIRRLRQQQLTEAAIAILSANAYDRGLDNDVGITPEDFIVKPLKVNALLDWLGKKLALEWVTADAPAAPPAEQPAEAPTCCPRRQRAGCARRVDHIGLSARDSQQAGRD